MKEKNIDRRVARTRRALQNALIQLILEKGYDNVTIEEITGRADLGRTTFYLHFKDKEDLLMQAIDTICDDFIVAHKTVLSRVKDQNLPLEKLQLNMDERIIYHIFSHARDHANFYKVMLSGEGVTQISHRFASIIQDETIRRLQNFPDQKIKVPAEVFAVSFSGILITLVTWWLENDQPYPIEAMVKYFQQIFLMGALDTINITIGKEQFNPLA